MEGKKGKKSERRNVAKVKERNQTPKKGQKKVQKKCARVREQAERVESGECLTRVMAEQGEGGEGGEDFGHEIDHCGNFFFIFSFILWIFRYASLKIRRKGLGRWKGRYLL